MVAGLNIASMLTKVGGLDGSPLYPSGEAFGVLRLTLGEVRVLRLTF